ncbi:UB-like protease 1A [Prunus dulcis]|uniref:UB-like protease 1A n=1 Tax=Prunus dulcis TaxID=3755 RepID=A0A5H2XUU3_PRUDU|nr:UB-like protease 1A [Prunus dulcis]
MSEQVNNTNDGKLFELGVKLRRENSNRFTVGLKKCKKFQHASERVRVALSLLKKPKKHASKGSKGVRSKSCRRRT